jgi:excisionase family DNA binding protein
MTTAIERLEHARRVCADAGVPLDCIGTLAVDYETAGRLLGGFSIRTIRQLVADGRMVAFRVGGSPRVELTELLDFIERNRVHSQCRPTRSLQVRAREALDGAA